MPRFCAVDSTMNSTKTLLSRTRSISGITINSSILCCRLGFRQERRLSCGFTKVSEIVELSLIKELHLRTVKELGIDGSVISGQLEELELLLNGIARLKELTLRTRDKLVSFGECMSTRVFAAYLNTIGVKAQQKMVERFFSAGNRKFEFRDDSEAITILSGPPSSSKTSLLFQFAFNSAAEGNAVVILCNRRTLHSHPPFLSQGVDPSSEISRRIQLKYVDDDEGIKNYFAAFHLHPTFPASIIIDNFGHFFDERNCQERYNNPRGRDLAMIRVLSLCRNAISYANKSSRCEILLSDTHKGDTPRLLYIYKRWVSCIYTIKEGDGLGSFVLRKSYSGMANAKPVSSAKYSIALQYLVLEGLVEGN